MSKCGCENKSASFIFLIFHSKNSIKLSWTMPSLNSIMKYTILNCLYSYLPRVPILVESAVNESEYEIKTHLMLVFVSAVIKASTARPHVCCGSLRRSCLVSRLWVIWSNTSRTSDPNASDRNHSALYISTSSRIVSKHFIKAQRFVLVEKTNEFTKNQFEW